MTALFLGIERISRGPWQAFDRAIERALRHWGYLNVRMIDGSGDGGADIVANALMPDGSVQTWIVQCKFRTGTSVPDDALDEVLHARNKYAADVAVVAANGNFSSAVHSKVELVRRSQGLDIRLWGPTELLELARVLPEYSRPRAELRPYQQAAVDAVRSSIALGERRGLILMATGLGKSRVAAEVASEWLQRSTADRILIVAHTRDLVYQLDRSLWRYLPKNVPTHVLVGNEKPSFTDGVTVATVQSLTAADLQANHLNGYGLVIVDEAHHAPADGYSVLLGRLRPRYLLGLTATPWRGDERDLEAVFGETLHSTSLVEGMRDGYLAQVDYRMMMDNIDWSAVGRLSGQRVNVKELNSRLFVKERDDAVTDKILAHALQMRRAKVLVFCRTIAHAEDVARRLAQGGLSASTIHSKKDRAEVTEALRRFSATDASALVTVDMLNEGIDLPDANMLVFMRVTHSRRIFVQQLGRGLRLADGKDRVLVLDFVADVRRIAAAEELNSDWSRATAEKVVVQLGAPVKFEGDEPHAFFRAYLADVAALQDADDDSILKFPG